MVAQTGKVMARTLEKMADEARTKNQHKSVGMDSSDDSADSTRTTLSAESVRL